MGKGFAQKEGIFTVGLMQLLSNHSGDLFDMLKGSVNGLHNAPNVVGDFFSQGLHLNKVPGILKEVFDTNPTQAAQAIVQKLDKAAHPEFYKLFNLGGTFAKAQHQKELAETAKNLGDIAKIGGIALPAFIGERLAAMGLRRGAKTAFNKATDVAGDKAAVKAAEQLNLVSAANDANLMARIGRVFGLSSNPLNGEVKSAYTKYAGKLKV